MVNSTAGLRKNWLGIHWTVWWVLGLALIALVIEHLNHALGILPYLIILACPLMHFFMHGKHGHGSHGHHADHREPTRRDKT